MRKKWILAVALFVAWGSGLSCGARGGKDEGSVRGAAPGFAGTYEVAGEGYTATLTVTQTGEGYHLVWDVDDGTRFYGKGLVVNDVLGVVFARSDGSGSGVVAYKKLNGEMSGLWASAGGETLSGEKAKSAAALRASSLDLEGTYAVTGTNPNGSNYGGELSLIGTGETWAAKWVTGGVEVYGTGLVVDNVAVLGYGNEAGVGVAVYEATTSGLDGIWMFTDYADLSSRSPITTGTEEARKQ